MNGPNGFRETERSSAFPPPPALMERGFRALVERLPVAVFRLDDDGRIGFANERAEALTGFPASALAHRAFGLTLVHPEDRHVFTDALRWAQAEGLFTCTLRLQPREGPLRLIDLHLVRTEAETFDAVALDPAMPTDDLPFRSDVVYQAFLEQSPVGVVHLDRLGMVTFENHRFRQLTGELVADVWSGTSIFEIGGLDATLHLPLQQMLAEGTEFRDVEAVYTRSDGTLRHLLVYGAPIWHPENGLLGGVLTLLDVTQQKERDDTLRVRARYDQAEPALRHAALSLSDPRDFLEEAARIFGLVTLADRAHLLLLTEYGVLVTSAEWTADPTLPPLALTLSLAEWPRLHERQTLLLHTLADPHAQALCRLLDAPEVLLCPLGEGENLAGALVLARTPVPDLPWTPAEARALDQLVGLFGTVWAWIRAETRYRQTVSGLTDGLFSFTYTDDGRRRYRFLTPQVERLLGHPVEPLLAEANEPEDWAAFLIAPEDHAAFHAHDQRLQTGQPSDLVYRIRRADGSEAWLRENATPRYEVTGTVLVGGILSDVTAQKAAEETLVEAKLAAERASQTKTAFMSTMSHEIRTPLGAINGFSDLLVDEIRELQDQGVALPEPVLEFVGVIRDNARRALKLVSDLFDLSKLETGSLRLQHVPVALHDVLERVAPRWRLAAEDQGLAFHWTLAEGAPMLHGDPYRLEQVIEHLLSNAVKFTEAGHIAVVTRLAPGQVWLEVADTGIGIAPEFLEGLFEPFAQEDYRLNRKYEGTGLGLAIVKRLVRTMGGQIRVHSEKGLGTRFEVMLPTLPAEAG